MTRRDFVALLTLAILVLAFVAWEMIGLTPSFVGLHTISYYAHAARWLDYLISALFLGGGIGGLIWWRHHVRSRIAK